MGGGEGLYRRDLPDTGAIVNSVSVTASAWGITSQDRIQPLLTGVSWMPLWFAPCCVHTAGYLKLRM